MIYSAETPSALQPLYNVSNKITCILISQKVATLALKVAENALATM